MPRENGYVPLRIADQAVVNGERRHRLLRVIVHVGDGPHTHPIAERDRPECPLLVEKHDGDTGSAEPAPEIPRRNAPAVHVQGTGGPVDARPVPVRIPDRVVLAAAGIDEHLVPCPFERVTVLARHIGRAPLEPGCDNADPHPRNPPENQRKTAAAIRSAARPSP